MKTSLKMSFLVASISVFTLSCEKRSQAKQEVTSKVSGSEQLMIEASDYDYRVVKRDGRIFLKPLFNDSEAFGPFVAHGTQGDRFIFHPKGQGRSKEFGSAQQIYQAREKGTWMFTDNYISMRACKVDFPTQREQR